MPNFKLLQRATNLPYLGFLLLALVASASKADAKGDSQESTGFVQLAAQLDDDGWRLTNQGWEHISTWESQPFSVSSYVPQDDPWKSEQPVIDLHPLAWTFMMIFFSFASLSLLPGSEPASA